MHGRNPAGQIAKLDAREPGFLDHRGERLLRGKAANAFGQIAIGLAILRGPLAQSRQRRKRVAFIKRIEPGRLDPGEFEAEKSSAGFQRPPDTIEHRLGRPLAATRGKPIEALFS